MAIWTTHIKYFINNPSIWLLGTWNKIKVGPIYLTSHCTFLKYLIYAGIPFFLIFYKNIYNLFKYFFKNKKLLGFNYLYPLIGYLIPSTMNDNFDFNYLPLMLALGMAMTKDNDIVSTIYKNIIKENLENKKLNSLSTKSSTDIETINKN